MTDDLIEAGRALADLLARENEALAALDFVAANAVSATKREAVDRFATAQSRASKAGALKAGAVNEGAIAPGAESRRVELLARALRDLAAENRRLLERAVEVQGRVIASIVRAIPKPSPDGQHYGASHAAYRRSMPPVALSARA